MAKHLALVVDADHFRSRKIAEALSVEDVGSIPASTLRTAVAKLSQHGYDVLIVCQNATKEHLEGFCRSVRRYAPTLTLVASLMEPEPELEEKLLDAGVDDVVTDRTPPRIIAKRIAVRLKGYSEQLVARGSVRLGDAIVDFDKLQVRNGGSSYRLSRGLARLLQYFIQNRSRPISRREAAESVWVNSVVDPEGRNLDMQVVKLRRLTERDPKNPVLIRTVRGVGYMLGSPS